MKHAAVSLASFYYSINMLMLLNEMNVITETEAENTIETLAEHYGVTDIYFL